VSDQPEITPEFAAMLDEFMDKNEEALRRLASVPAPILGEPCNCDGEWCGGEHVTGCPLGPREDR
jgi:hypothetical protein